MRYNCGSYGDNKYINLFYFYKKIINMKQEKELKLEKFCFPEYSVVFEAESLEEANKMLQNYLFPKK